MEIYDTGDRRSSFDRRQAIPPIDIADRRSGGDRRGSVDRRSGIERRSPKGFRTITGQDRKMWRTCSPRFSFSVRSDSVLKWNGRATEESIDGR